MTAIYHITHVKNLARIVRAGGLWCDTRRAAQSVDCLEIAHQHIKDRRAVKVVPVAAGGKLAEYVPFYFAPRSPMLYAIDKGKVLGYDGGQEPIIHLVSSVELAVKIGQPWAFTDGHADMGFTAFFDDLNRLDRIDWELMRATYWNDTVEHPDRKRRRQAEFLVHTSFPWSAVTEIGVMTSDVQDQCKQTIAGAEHCPPVNVKRYWYY